MDWCLYDNDLRHERIKKIMLRLRSMKNYDTILTISYPRLSNTSCASLSIASNAFELPY